MLVTSVAWSPDGQQLANGSYDKSIRVWDAESGKSVATLQVRCGGWTGWMDGHKCVPAYVRKMHHATK
jgi:WD40 repeat protein